jgi:nucleotide-binding universal stress UspA family protein
MYHRILVPLDGSKLAECVLPHVEVIAKGCDEPEIIFLRVVQPYFLPASGEQDDGGHTYTKEEHDKIKYENEGKARDYLVRVASLLDLINSRPRSVVLVSDKVAETISEYAEHNNIDYVIVSSHGHSGIAHLWWGNVTERLLHLICVPLTVIRAPGCRPER